MNSRLTEALKSRATQYLKALTIGCTAALLIASCAAPYRATSPDGFARYRCRSELRTVSPEGVLFRVRHVKNKPYADLTYWKEAFRKRMQETGYRIISEEPLDRQPYSGALFTLAAPVGQNDYLFIVSIIPTRKKIIIVETSGDARWFNKRRDAVMQALAALQIR